MASLSYSAGARAEAGGPDYWDVTGVRAGDVLNLRARGEQGSPVIGRIPHGATGLRNLGCSGGPTFAQWQRMSAEERAKSARSRWCRVEFKGKQGWVAGRFLKEGSGPAPAPARNAAAATFGRWTLSCAPTCRLEQIGVGTSRRTVLTIELREATNAQFTIARDPVPRSGTLAIYMDGDTISQGPIAPLVAPSGNALVLQPDDITAGLLRQMARHKNMVLSLPGEERGVEIQLDGFQAAWKALVQRTGR